MHRILAMHFCVRRSQRMITKLTDVTSQRMKFLYPTVQKAILQIFRRFSLWTIKLRYVIRFTRFMWIPTLWQAEPALTIRKSETWSDVIYMPCTAENNFCPELPKETPDIIYLCFPNNPTGEAITKEQLQVWVDYANKAGAVIIYDAAYKAYITEKKISRCLFISVKVQKPVPLSFAAFQDSRIYRTASCVHSYPERAQMRRCTTACTLDKKTRHKIQRCTLHHQRAGERYIPRLERLRSQNRSHIITRMHLISSTDSKKPAIPLRAA